MKFSRQREQAKASNSTKGRVAPLTLIPLWKFGSNDIRLEITRLLKRGLESSDLVVVQLGKPSYRLDSGELRALGSKGVRVVTVANTYEEYGSEDDALHQAVELELREQNDLMVQTIRLSPPEVDQDVAHAVERFCSNLPRATPGQRREFLDEFYGSDEPDDVCASGTYDR